MTPAERAFNRLAIVVFFALIVLSPLLYDLAAH